MERKYEFTDETIKVGEITLHRIKAVRGFANIKAGGLGGFIEKEGNLSHNGNAWVYGNAKVYDNARVYGNAKVYDVARVYGNADVYGNTDVCGNAKVYGDALVCGNAWIYGNADVCGNAQINNIGDYIVFKNFWSSGRYFTYTRSNKMWKVGCFYGTGEELITKAYQDSQESGWNYEQVVRYVENNEKQVQRVLHDKFKPNDNMDKNFSMMQLIMAALLFLCAVGGVLTHIFMGHIDTFGGHLFAIIIIVMSWIFLRLSWKELKYSNSN